MVEHDEAPRDDEPLSRLLAGVPEDELDSAEVEGGLTWRQVILLAATAGYLRDPADTVATPPFDERLIIRKTVEDAIIDRFADGSTTHTALEAIILGLEVAESGYAGLSEASPELANDRDLVRSLLDLWRSEDLPYITEKFASNVLYCMAYPRSA